MRQEPTLWRGTRDGKKGQSAPAANLELEWVHGYRAFDCRNNLRYVKLNIYIIFSVATHIYTDN